MKNAKELILEHTFILMLERGLDGVSVSGLQEATGLSRGLLYRYYKSKDELILEVCKRYFFERYFTFDVNLNEISLGDFINLAEKSARHLFKSLENISGKKINILRYNMLYADVLDRLPQFKDYAASEIKKMRIVLKNAISRGEIKDLPVDFLENVLLDILGRVACLSSGNNPKISDIFKDSKRFYKLIKKG
ncbi:MAG: TetR/AcrR family transcriptional regulator [Opitutales bacterium]|nr:TetR/AcrR family transcriptional regulator [Opitutales bacterium]